MPEYGSECNKKIIGKLLGSENLDSGDTRNLKLYNYQA
jgi:hypothetical protein